MSLVINSLPQLSLKITLKIPLFSYSLKVHLVWLLYKELLYLVSSNVYFICKVSSRHFDEILGQRGFKNVKWSTILVFLFS